MKKIVKQVLGIDIAQNELVCCFGRQIDDFNIEIVSRKTFKNSKPGFEVLRKWLNQISDKSIFVRFVMEATGVYHESIAYFALENGYDVSVVLPNKISNYFRTLSVKTITDESMSEAIMQFGLERKLENWEPPKEIYRNMQQLTRERDQIVSERTAIKNQIHAESSSAHPYKPSIDRLQKRLLLLNKQEAQIKKELSDIVKKDAEVDASQKLLCSIPGIGKLTAQIVLAETNGFNLIRNKRQLASYAGFDIKEKLSGTSVKGKPKISKRGNKQLRKAMYMPALAAIKNNDRFKAVYVRIVSKTGVKMKAAVAVQRKLLEMMFTIYKTKRKFDINYFDQNIITEDVESTEIVME